MFFARVGALGAWHCALGRLWLAARPPATERLFCCRTRRLRRKMTRRCGRKSGPNNKRRRRGGRRPPTERKWPHGRTKLAKTLTFVRTLRPMRTTATPRRRKASAPSGDRPVARAFLPPRTVCTGRLVTQITLYRSAYTCLFHCLRVDVCLLIGPPQGGMRCPVKTHASACTFPGGLRPFFTR